MSALLEVRDLSVHLFTARGVVHAVNSISFSLEAGRTLGLVGESGCGKSMTALALMRLIPSPPGRIVGGTIHFEGEDVVTMDAAALRALRGNRISMIYQDPMTSLNPVFSVGEQIAEAVRLHRGDRRTAAWSQAAEMLRLVGIADPDRIARAYPHQLSGGMRQRAVIAMALACGPRLLVADEPTTALDVTIQAQILELLRRLQGELGMAVIMITHDLGVVADLVDDVAVMYAGSIVEYAPVRQLFASPRHPYTQGLLRSVPSLEMRAHRLNTIDGVVPSPFAIPAGCAFHPRCNLAMDTCRATAPVLSAAEDGGRVACWMAAHDPAANPASKHALDTS
jgi:oligopeptide/dipeptide ABC transporter ATP-binding protein